MQQYGGLEVESFVGFLAEDPRRGAMGGRVEEADVAYRPHAEIVDQGHEVLDVEVVGHRPRRSSRSA